MGWEWGWMPRAAGGQGCLLRLKQVALGRNLLLKFTSMAVCNKAL